MLELHGFAASNYYAFVKAALLEKGLDFNEVLVYPPTESAMGKVPVLVTEHGPIAESQVIVDYLEEAYPEPNLYPQDPYGRAKVRELMRIMELYIELAGRPLFGEAYFGLKVPQDRKTEAREVAERGAAAVKALASFSPYIAGSSLTYADISAVISMNAAYYALEQLTDFDVVGAVPGLGELIDTLSARDSIKQAIASRDANIPEFVEMIKRKLTAS